MVPEIQNFPWSKENLFSKYFQWISSSLNIQTKVSGIVKSDALNLWTAVGGD